MLQVRFNDQLSQDETEAIMGTKDKDWVPFETDPEWWALRLLLIAWFGGSTYQLNLWKEGQK